MACPSFKVSDELWGETEYINIANQKLIDQLQKWHPVGQLKLKKKKHESSPLRKEAPLLSEVYI